MGVTSQYIMRFKPHPVRRSLSPTLPGDQIGQGPSGKSSITVEECRNRMSPNDSTLPTGQCSSSSPSIHSVGKNELEFLIHLLSPQVLGLQACIRTPGFCSVGLCVY